MDILNAIESRSFINVLKKYDIDACYLFGSQARGKATPLSDVDVAILFGESVNPDEYLDLRVNIATDLMKVFQKNNMDIVALNNSYPAICFKVVSAGRLVYEKNRGRRIAAETRIRRIYFDMAYLRKTLNTAMERRLA